MRMDPYCFQCLLSRVRFECSLVLDEPDAIEAILERCRNRLEVIRSQTIPAPHIATEIHRTAYRLMHSEDPYESLKRSNNTTAWEVCTAVRPLLSTFREKVLASIIGNTMDYAVECHTVAEDFRSFFQREFRKGLAIDNTEAMLSRAARVVYFTDNCGEIVFDRLVLEHLARAGSHITLAVKGAPILNDATLDDARALRLDTLVDILTTTGSGDVGVSLEKIPPELASALDSASLVIAKGMANYEALNEEEARLPPIAYLLAAKCDPIARSIGVPRGSYVAMLASH
ncbi:MAG: ARMT1-like domain-containing protein [Methanomicrobiales archaeon]|nr:ARMT1-like domain-containing protein [Methanomicrobiales archaeon]